MNQITRIACSLAVAALVAPACAQQKLELKPEDHVAILGYSIADRMQHSGYLETLIQQAHPDAKLVFRNLAAAGDEVGTWHRSESFGSREEWLKKVGADVVFAFYGFNESFKGAGGVEAFKKQLDDFLKGLAKANFSGKGAPRVVLFSPAAAERHQDPNFPDPKAMNANVQMYSAAMAEVAKANGVQFVDVFGPSLKAMEAAAAMKQSLTWDGRQLTEEGDKVIAPLIFRGLFDTTAPAVNEKLRAAVNEKNWQWHQRYRTIDGFNVYGGRSKMKYTAKGRDGKNGETFENREVMQREMSQRDVMTANRDARVWAVAKGGELAVKDDNLPAPIIVKTNKPGDKEDLSHTYPSGEEVIAKLQVAKGCKVNLFADEKMFPELVNPVQMAWDTRGRLWVSAWKNYPERTPTSKDGDKILIFEDTDHDGKADKCSTFLDDLNGPTGFAIYKDGALVMQAPDLWFVRDTNGDGKADWKERIAMGIDSADSHHTTNAMVWEPGGATFFSDGVFHRTQIETAEGPLRHSDGCLWRFEPRTGKADLYAAYELVNPHGKVFDYWGNDLVTNATENKTFFAAAISGRLDSGKHPGMNQFWNRPSRPCPGTGMVSSAHFPEDWQGDFLNCNVIGLQAITRVKVAQDGSGLKGTTVENLVAANPATLPSVRPICVSNAPDGSIFFCDWSQTIIGHLQHHLRDPNRNHEHGRIYRVTYEGRPLATPPKIHGQPVEALLELLKSPIDDTRALAKIELDNHPSEKVIAAAAKWVAALDRNDREFEHHQLEALWLHQWQNVVNVELLDRVLKSPHPQARAAAVRVLCYWRDRVPDVLPLLKTAAADADPRVRLHAVRAASFFQGKDVPTALDVAFVTLAKEQDYYLDYTFKETLRQLNSLTKEPYFPKDPAAAAAYIKTMPDNDLLKASDSSEPVLVTRIDRKTINSANRDKALTNLAGIHKTTKTAEIVAALGRNAASAEDLGKLLAAAPAADLKASRAALGDTLKANPGGSVARAVCAALITADDGPDGVWNSTANDPAARTSVLEALPFIANPPLRAKFQPLLAKAITDPKTRAAAFMALPLMGPANAKNNFTILSNAVRTGMERTVAARAAMQIPRESWSRDAAGPVATSVLDWAKTVPDKQRSGQEYVQVAQFAGEIAGLLPAAEAARIRKELRGLGVSVFVIRTVHEQMRYDSPRIVVEVGKPFEIILENGDNQPHNLVVVKPGAHEAVGQASALMTPDKLDKQGRAYIPKLPEILEATKTIEPGQSDTIKMTAQKEEGEYEYVCTLPGHFIVMWGKLIVTKDVDAYLAANPQALTGPDGAPHAHKK